MEKTIETVINYLLKFGKDLLIAIIILVVGFKLIKLIIKILNKSKGFNKLERSVQTFLKSFISIALKIILFIIAAGVIGIPMTSLITILGSAGIAIGLALQGGLSNIAGGLMILIFKPYKVGDYISYEGTEGTVLDISMFYTKLTTVDNKIVTIPNSNISSSVVIDYTANKKRRIDLDFSVDYKSDIEKVKKVLKDVISEQELVLKDEDIIIWMTKHDDSAIIFSTYSWVKTSDYLKCKAAILEDVKKAFDKNNISIPYPQVDVHLDKITNKWYNMRIKEVDYGFRK